MRLLVEHDSFQRPLINFHRLVVFVFRSAAPCSSRIIRLATKMLMVDSRTACARPTEAGKPLKNACLEWYEVKMGSDSSKKSDRQQQQQRNAQQSSAIIWLIQICVEVEVIQ